MNLDFGPAAIEVGLCGGFELALSTLALTILLESISLDTVRNLWTKQSGGRVLYWKGVAVNLFNHIVLGVPVYTIAVLFFCQALDHEPPKLGISLIRIASLILIHNLCYFYVHRAFHEHSYYRFHKFHHQYHQWVPPSAANAVSIVEYLVAYVLPFALAALLLRPTPLELQRAIGVLSVNNLLVHTPCLQHVSMWVEPYFVSTRSHLEHHQRLTVHYASPVWNVDYWLGSSSTARNSHKED